MFERRWIWLFNPFGSNKNGTDPNCTDMWSFTPLHEAIMKNRDQVCSLLLAYKADPYVRNCYDKSPFDLAYELDKNVFDKILVEYYGYALLDAIRLNDIIKFKRILSQDLARVKTEILKSQENSSEENQLALNLLDFKDCELLNSAMVLLVTLIFNKLN